jgi:hypothetical protein
MHQDVLHRILIAVLAAVALSGCEQLRVESIPAGEVVACDQAFGGWWRVEAESPELDDADTLHLHVSDDCAQWITIETDADGQRTQEDLSTQMRFDFRRVGEAGYLARIGRAGQSRTAGTRSAMATRCCATSFAQGRIDLFEGDPRREAHRIGGGTGGAARSNRALTRSAARTAIATSTPRSPATAMPSRIGCERFDPIDRAFVELRRVDDRAGTELDALLEFAAGGRQTQAP